MDLTQLEPRWHVLNEHLAWAPLYPPPPPEDLPLYEIPFEVFILVRSKSDSPTGRAVHNWALGVLRGDERAIQGFEIDRKEVLEIPSEFRFTLLRSNAEVPANPVHHLLMFGVNPAAQLVAGFDWKQHQDDAYA
jgi:hypothetical protein